MKIIFYGTPRAAVPFLELLAARGQVMAVVSQPDKPSGRSLKVEPTPVKKKALELGIPVFAPASPSKICAELQGLKPDLAVVVAYGRLLKPDVLAVPKLGTLNVHYSLLPKYRGAAPVQWSLVRGETATGVTLFWLDEGMDTGPIFLSKKTEIGPDEDALSLMNRLTELGREALGEALAEIAAGRIRREAQSGGASLAPLIKREDARIALSMSAGQIHNLVRGMRIWPKAYLEPKEPHGKRIIVLKTALEAPGEPADAGSPGRVLRVDRGGGILVQCAGSSRLWFLAVQPEGKNPVTAAEFLNGLRLAAGDFLPVG